MIGKRGGDSGRAVLPSIDKAFLRSSREPHRCGTGVLGQRTRPAGSRSHRWHRLPAGGGSLVVAALLLGRVSRGALRRQRASLRPSIRALRRRALLPRNRSMRVPLLTKEGLGEVWNGASANLPLAPSLVRSGFIGSTSPRCAGSFLGTNGAWDLFSGEVIQVFGVTANRSSRVAVAPLDRVSRDGAASPPG